MTGASALSWVTAWRAWNVAEIDATPRLTSVVFDEIWEPDARHLASCYSFRPWSAKWWRSHRTAHDVADCSCGVHGFRNLADALVFLIPEMSPNPPRWPILHRVFGRVRLSGTTAPTARGWRAAIAYPVDLFVPAPSMNRDSLDGVSAVAESLGVYGVPRRLVVPGDSDEISQAFSKFLENPPDIVEPKHRASAAVWF
jgi:hypothetical protein